MTESDEAVRLHPQLATGPAIAGMGDAARHRELAAVHRHRRFFIAGLGIGQIISWGSLYYSFPLIAGPMGHDLALSSPEIYGAATIGVALGSLATYPIGRVRSAYHRVKAKNRCASAPYKLGGQKKGEPGWSGISLV